MVGEPQFPHLLSGSPNPALRLETRRDAVCGVTEHWLRGDAPNVRTPPRPSLWVSGGHTRLWAGPLPGSHLLWFPSVRLGETRGQALYALTPLLSHLPASLRGRTAFILWSREAAGQDGGNGWKQRRVSSRATRQMWTGSTWKNEGLYASGLMDCADLCWTPGGDSPRSCPSGPVGRHTHH